MTQARVHVRPARAGEAARIAPLLYGVNPELHDRFAGGRERALQQIATAFERPGHSGSADAVRVAEVDSQPVGVIGLYPVWEGAARARADVRLALRTGPRLRRPLLLAFVYRMQRAVPDAPLEALYVDALGTAPEYRRQGVARALLATAEQEARQFGLIRVGLETEVSNTAARNLYESCGYLPSAQGRRVRGLPRFLSYVREMGATRPATRQSP